MADGSPWKGGPDSTLGTARERRLSPEQRRDLLLDAADTVIRRVGPRVSATLIAEEAGITKPIIYRHFGDIQDLYRALAARHDERLGRWLLAARERDADLSRRDRLRGMIDAFFIAIDRESNLYRFLVYAGADIPGKDSALSWFTRIWSAQIADHLAALNGEPEPSLQSRALGLAIAGSLHTTGNWWLEERPSPLSEVVDAVTDLLISGMPVPTVEPSELGMGGTNA